MWDLIKLNGAKGFYLFPCVLGNHLYNIYIKMNG